MSIRFRIVVLCALAALSVAVTCFPPAPGAPPQRLVHSFAPTPLYRGIAEPGRVLAQADLYTNSRTFGGVTLEASFEIAVDFAVLDPKTGEMIADHCVTRSFAMRTPLDLKKIRIQVVENGVQVLFPDGELDSAELFQPGDEVEVVILALALRGDGRFLAGVEKATLLIEADLDGDGELEAPITKDADWQTGIFTS